MKRLELPEKEIAVMYQEGHSSVAIAEKFEVDASTIRNRLREQGVEITRRGKSLGVRRKAEPVRLPDTVLAYLAGVIDSDGTILMTNQYGTTVAVYCTSKELIDWIQSRYAANLYSRLPPSSISRKMEYSWRLFAQNSIREFLASIFPYMIVKANQAQVMLDYIDRKISAEETYQKLKRLKREDNKLKVLTHGTKETDIAYTAGIIDSDGYISLKKYEKHGIHKIVGIATCSRVLVDWLKKRFPTGRTFERMPASPYSKKKQTTWYLTVKEPMIEFLTAIMPFMVIKKEQANAMLQFLNKEMEVDEAIRLLDELKR